MSRTTSLLALTVASLAVATSPVTARPAPGPAPAWVHTWTAMPQLTEPHNMPPPPFTQDGLVMADTTLRQTVQPTFAGRTIRLRFSNAFGGAALPLTSVAVARPAGGAAGVSAIVPGTSRPITFSGKPSTVIPVGAQVVSDPLVFPVAAQENLTITTYLADGQASNAVTSHPGSRTTSHLLAGNHTTSPDLPAATPTNHWYFLSGIEAHVPASSVAVLGDSLSDGRGSTTNGNDRWPDRLASRLHPRSVAVLNQAAGGNRVLNDGLGPSALARFDRDILSHSGVRWVIVFEGINDIGTAAATETDQKQVGDDLIAAYEQLVTRAHAQGIQAYGATLLPFDGNTGYDDPAGLREQTRQRVNHWIKTSRTFDAVIDFDRTVRNPANPTALNPAYDEGDHLHLNPAGYQALANAVPTHLFTPGR